MKISVFMNMVKNHVTHFHALFCFGLKTVKLTPYYIPCGGIFSQPISKHDKIACGSNFLLLCSVIKSGCTLINLVLKFRSKLNTL